MLNNNMDYISPPPDIKQSTLFAFMLGIVKKSLQNNKIEEYIFQVNVRTTLTKSSH